MNAILKPNRPNTASWYEDRLCTSPDHAPDTQHYYTNNAASEIDLQAKFRIRLVSLRQTAYVLCLYHVLFSARYVYGAEALM